MCRSLPALLAILLWPTLLMTDLGAEQPARPSDDDTADPKLAAPFELPAVEAGVARLAKSSDQQLTVVCFLGTECPLSRLYGQRLAELSQAYQDKPVRFVGLNSNYQDSPDEVRKYASEYGIRFPIAKDYENKLAGRYGVRRTPEVVVVDQDLVIQYRGRVDDQYVPGRSRTEPTRHDLRNAIDELLAGNPVSVARTEPVGCLLTRVESLAVGRSSAANDAAAQASSSATNAADATEPLAGGNPPVTYANQISRILQRHCVECHRPGEIGPFALTDYDEIVGWVDMILEVVDQGRMPPWHANPEFGHFDNARQMPERDKQLLHQWAAAGAPFGDAKDLPEQPEYVAGWQLPQEPELVLAMGDKPFHVPADGTVDYQYFVVDPKFTEEKWVKAAEVIPGNRSVVHHSLVFIRPPDGESFNGMGWLAAYVPGQRTGPLAPGMARRIPAGSKLVFQQHYTPNGRAQDDLTRLGLIFADPDEVTHEVYSIISMDQEFEIPPGAPDHVVRTRLTRFPQRGTLLTIAPHMHLRGRAFRITVDRQSGSEVLLDVPNYDFNWQHIYRLAEPMPLENIKAFDLKFTFDNSADNPVNPDPTKRVTWGDQTWKEMAIAYFDVAVPLSRESEVRKKDASVDPRRRERASRFARQFVERFDQDGDRLVSRSETPITFRAFGFSHFDRDGNGQLSLDEVRVEAERR